MKTKTKKFKRFSQKEYLQKSGCHCPNCNSQKIAGRDFQSDLGLVWQVIDCLDCNASWTDTYKLEGYSELTLTAKVKPMGTENA